MRLGICSWFHEEDFRKAKQRGLDFVELDVNYLAEEFLEHLDDVERYSKEYEMPVAAIGRWGCKRIDANGINPESLDLEYRLIDAAARLHTEVYITGCNYVDTLSYYENCTLAISLFEKLIAYAKPHGIKIAVYNCRWENFVCDDMAWTVICGHLKDLYIKYDSSHCFYAGGDYLAETKKWVHRFAHVHLKGILAVNGERVDDPPAGMDQVNWPAYLAILYANGYNGTLSIEPHSDIWKGELGEKGIDYSVEYMRKLVF